MPAVIFTGLEKLTCCQPLAVSLVNVAVASKVPVALHRSANMSPGVQRTLVEANAGDFAAGGGRELDADLHAIWVIYCPRKPA